MPSSGRCCYCRRFMFPAGSPEVRADPDCQHTRDHVIPRTLNRVRLDVAKNIGPSCHGCNQLKGDAPAEVFMWFIRQPRPLDDTKELQRREFKQICYALTLAGFKAASRDVISRRPRQRPSVFTFQPTAEQHAENDAEEPVWMKNKVRVGRGRFARKPIPEMLANNLVALTIHGQGPLAAKGEQE